MDRLRFSIALLACLAVLTLAGQANGVRSAGAIGMRSNLVDVRLPTAYLSVHLPAGLTEQTAGALASTGAPVRDLAALTQRLKLGGVGSVPQTVNSRPPNYAVGTRHKFYVADIGDKSYFTVNATIRYVTAHAYWYAKDGMALNLAALKASADRFESRIYPTDRRVFGPEVSPGVDNDPHITVLMAPIPGVGGYFSAADAFPRIVNPYSNQRDMIYMASLPTPNTGDPSNYFEATLAHEFQHMIEWNVHRNRDIWLDEGCSEIAMYANGYDPGGVDTSFVLHPDTQLNAWDEPPNTGAHYGASYLFLRYLMDHYGGERFISNLLKQDTPGTSGIDQAIQQAGNPLGFDGAFKDWTVANVLNDKTLAGGRYSYSQGGRVGAGRGITSYPATRSDTVHQYAADYIALGGNLGPARITFQGNSAVPVVAAGPHSGRYYWYANRQDSADATLTRELDLTGTARATLRVQTWYDIERLFDYAYIEASTDGGKSWTILPGKYTTTENSNGTGFGAGWTGKSGVAAGSNRAAGWVEEQVDLSRYAGKRALVRFEYVTDEGYNRPGFLVDDISVPEIGYKDDAEADTGWAAEGFVRIGGSLPQRWFVALIERGSPNRIREMVVGSDGTGSLDLSGLGPGSQIRDAVLVVAPLAPKTTETASYTVTVRRK